ncbi:substrate-binding domain-containing protein [Rhodococcus kronopolitis]|uniref:Substrate-binding domain-containing protein n=1 Tax=Rhodococcus kronopolitis TaxID=1460226 RepID=A0ABV9FWE0_9NOCA
MGQHRGDEGARGVSKGPVIAGVALVLVVLAVFGWMKLRDRISEQGTAAAQTCVEGDAVLDVSADPDIAIPLGELARRYNDTAPVVRDHCISVTVTPAPGTAVADSLATGDPAHWSGPGPAPALWIPQSSQTVNRLADHPGLVSGQPKSIASSPVVLAAPPLLAAQLTQRRTGWQDLAGLQSDPQSLTASGLPGWGSLRLALPTGPQSEPTALAAEAVAAAVSGAGAGPVTAEQAASGPVVTALSQLGIGSAFLAGGPPANTADALTALAAQTDQAAGTLHAVPATEQQVYRANRTDAALATFTPTGATPVADHPAAVLAAGWVDETRSRAAAQFADFLLQPEQAQTLHDQGFRAGDSERAGADAAVPFAPVTTALAPSSGAVSAALTDVVAHPVEARSTTVLLDVSGSMSATEGSDTRLHNTATTLAAQITATPDGSDVGLWTYSRGLDGTKPYRVLVPTGPLTGPVAGVARRQALETALGSLTPATATSTYASVEAAYRAAVNGYASDRPNSLLLITDGPNDDTSTSARQMLSAVAAAADPDRPVRIDVVTIGPNSDTATLEQLAQQTGGTLIPVATSDGPELGQSIGKLLS